MSSKPEVPGTVSASGEQNEMPNSTETASAPDMPRGYIAKDLSFDPMKDLNLPQSYDEVVSRFKKLQGGRSAETLN